MHRFLSILKALLLPFLLAIYPSLFLYSNNASILTLMNLFRILLIQITVLVILYLIFYFCFGRKPLRAAIGTAIFLVFYQTYGIAYRYLLERDLVRIEHYTLLPLYVFLALYIFWVIKTWKRSRLQRLWNISTLILGGLVLYNLVLIVPHEVEKAKTITPKTVVSQAVNIQGNYPDIYFIVMDEFSGFQPIRDYWNYPEVDEFKQYLVDSGFFVAEQTHGLSTTTVHEMTTRLNYQSFPCCLKYQQYFEALANNEAMAFLKARGYTTIVFNSIASFFPADRPLVADYLFEGAPNNNSTPILIDEFGMLTLNNTMLSVASDVYQVIYSNPEFGKRRDMIYFTRNNFTTIGNSSTPKFVYAHLMVPHVPFMFDANGNVLDEKHYFNWDLYLENYIFATKLAREMVDKILAQADPDNPPIIILQSDHGARNISYGSNLLIDYPTEYKTWILYSLYIPGYDFSQLTQDISPVNTFPLIFNHLFDAGIPLPEP